MMPGKIFVGGCKPGKEIPRQNDAESSEVSPDTDMSSDTSNSESSSSESLSVLEYEVASLSEKEHDHPFNSYSSGTDSVGVAKEWPRKNLTEEADGSKDDNRSGTSLSGADSSSAASDTVVGYGENMSMSRKCIKCNNYTFFFQYCDRCYKVRKDFFPLRPKKYKKRNKSSQPISKKKSYIKKIPVLSLNDVKDERRRESGGNQELTSISRDTNPTDLEKLCNVCLVNPKNAAFLHCRWVHIYSCYQCSCKIWFTTKCCPLCNNRAEKVLKVAM